MSMHDPNTARKICRLMHDPNIATKTSAGRISVVLWQQMQNRIQSINSCTFYWWAGLDVRFSYCIVFCYLFASASIAPAVFCLHMSLLLLLYFASMDSAIFFCICWHWWIGFLHLMMVRIGLSGYCFGLRVLVFRLVLGLLKPVFLVLQTLVLIFWAWFCSGSLGYILINPYLYLLFVLRYFFSLQIKNK